MLIEQVRRRLCREHGEPCQPIEDHDHDARARRITAYLDLLDGLIRRQVERVRESAFEAGSEIVRYFRLMAPSPLRDLYRRMESTADGPSRERLESRLRAAVSPGSIDVNIMTKLDRDHDRRGRKLPERCSDALSALRGFMRSKVDASVVLVNASTRFNDGGQLGLGAEMGISTSKLHAFGPMGLEELTTRKFVVLGDGQIRE